ncbi:signal peptidase I [Arthrobacter alpinus]|uniref:Signal peptidase I n=1 Tax=Arthrobacter alpinus TaxID=656366 RepID=A0A1H5PFI8_9MICC|nr:signal peptidase I [Arthrobacter alpinus]SEF12615.1 signal peptidase I [Arthrobacter alpinus]
MDIRRIAQQGARRNSRGLWFESPWRIAGRAFSTALAVLAVGALLALVVVPRMLGGDSLTVLSGSMEPTFSPGDIVVVKGLDEAGVCADVSVGSIVTFFPKPNEPTLITHRVVGKTIGTFDDGTHCRLVTQGDSNSSVDAPVSPAQVRGQFMFGVPQLGWVRQWAGENTQILLFTGAAIVIAWGLWGAIRSPRTTVMTVPRTTAGSPADVAARDPFKGTPDVTAGTGEDADWGANEGERDLRERELAVRERDLELRERELAFAHQRGALATIYSESVTLLDFPVHVPNAPHPSTLNEGLPVPLITNRFEA